MTTDPHGEGPAVEITALDAGAWREMRALRLRALADAPAAFGSRYDSSLAQPDAHWQARMAEAAREESSWYRFARRGGPGGELVGMTGAFLPDEYPAGDVAVVIAVFVAPEVRGRGVGARLLAAIVEALRASRRVRRVHLDVNPAQGPAVRLYRRAGFRETGRGVRLMGDGREHAVLQMALALEGQGAGTSGGGKA